MKTLWVSAVAAALWFLPGAAAPADLTKVQRAIAKEPAYASKQPRYCLLVFGPQAATRVWLVIDGDFLYIDRNGNGDLTEPGERVRFAAFRAAGEGPIAEAREAEAGVVWEGKLKHERLVVKQQRVRKSYTAKEPWEVALLAGVDKGGDDLVYQVSVFLEIRPRSGDPIRIAGRVHQSAGTDGAGFLQFADRPEAAPVVHFRGPLQMGLHVPQRLPLGAEGGNLEALVGTPGLGKGTFAAVSYDGLITAGASPVAEIEFPAASGGSLSRARYILPHRC
jgi:hypothetical protein